MFESCRVAASSKNTAVNSNPVAEVATSLHLGEVEDKAVAVVLVMAMLAMVLVLLDMEKNLLMMEEEKGRPYLQLVRQTHPLTS